MRERERERESERDREREKKRYKEGKTTRGKIKKGREKSS